MNITEFVILTSVILASALVYRVNHLKQEMMNEVEALNITKRLDSKIVIFNR